MHYVSFCGKGMLRSYKTGGIAVREITFTEIVSDKTVVEICDTEKLIDSCEDWWLKVNDDNNLGKITKTPNILLAACQNYVT